MIKGEVQTPTGRRVLVLGLERENINRLGKDMPIRINVHDLRAQGFRLADTDDIVIYANAPEIAPERDKIELTRQLKRIGGQEFQT